MCSNDPDRLNDLENAILHLQQKADRNQRNGHALMILLCFFLLLCMIGVKFKNDRLEWELTSKDVAELLSLSAVSGVGITIAKLRR